LSDQTRERRPLAEAAHSESIITGASIVATIDTAAPECRRCEGPHVGENGVGSVDGSGVDSESALADVGRDLVGILEDATQVRCHAPLSRPSSVRAELGPVCRRAVDRDELEGVRDE